MAGIRQHYSLLVIAGTKSVKHYIIRHRKIEEQGRKDQEQEAIITQLKSTVPRQQKDFQSTVAKLQKDFPLPAAQQQKEIQVLTASLKEQAAQVQKVSEQLESANRSRERSPALSKAAAEICSSASD